MSRRDDIAEIIKKETERYDNAYWTCADKIIAYLKREDRIRKRELQK